MNLVKYVYLNFVGKKIKGQMIFRKFKDSGGNYNDV